MILRASGIKGHRDAPDRGATGGARHGSGEDPHRGRLAGAVRAQEAGHPAGLTPGLGEVDEPRHRPLGHLQELGQLARPRVFAAAQVREGQQVLHADAQLVRKGIVDQVMAISPRLVAKV